MNSDATKILDLTKAVLVPDFLVLWYGSEDNTAIPEICYPVKLISIPFKIPDIAPCQSTIEYGHEAFRLLPVAFRVKLGSSKVAAVLSTRGENNTGVIAVWLDNAKALPANLPALGDICNVLWCQKRERMAVGRLFMRARAELRRLARSMPQGVIIVPLGPQQAFCNDIAANMLGLTGGEIQPELLRDNLQKFLSELVNAKVVMESIEAVLQMRAVLYECDLELRGQGILSLNLSPVYLGEKLDGWLWLLEDVTSKRLAYSALEYARLNALNEKEAKSRFLSTMTHEIRSPIHAVLGLLSLLDENVEQPEQKRLVDQSKRTVDLLLGLVNDVLDYSKLEARKLQAEKSLFNLKEVIGDVETIIYIQADKKGLPLHFSIPEDIPVSLVGDGRHLSQVLINLLTNAVKFTTDGHVTLTLTVLKRENDVCRIGFEVEDTGIGMEANKLHSIFDAYVQAESNTASKYGGTGLGLYISRALVEVMGGSLNVESEPGKGSKFFFTLDFEVGRVDNLVVNAQPPVTEVGNSNPDAVLAGRKVLLAEDNKMIRTLAIRYLERLGASVYVAENGIQAVDVVKNSNDLELVLMDMRMPEMSGFEAAKIIRQSKTPQQLPIIAMSGDTSAAEGELEEAGFNATLQKPFRAESMVAVIKSVLKN